MDALRGIAVLLVFVTHAIGPAFGRVYTEWSGLFRDPAALDDRWWLPLFRIARFGVAMLLVLSGFSVHRSHLRRPEESLRRYFVRRVLGLYPPYLVALILFAFVLPWTRVDLLSADGGIRSEGILQLTTHLLLVHNWDERTFAGLNPSLWTLAVEVQLYALYPILLWMRRTAGWRPTLWILGGLELTVRLASEVFRDLPTLHRVLIGSPFAYWFCWALGAYLADHLGARRASTRGRAGDDTPPRAGDDTPARAARAPSPEATPELPPAARVPAAMIALAYAAAFGFYFFRPLDVLIYPLAATAAFWICARVVQREASDRTVGPPERAPGGSRLVHAFAAVGVMSYSVYLLHQPLIRPIPWALAKAGFSVPPEGVFLICLASFGLVLVPARLLYLWVEVPARRLSRARFAPWVNYPSKETPASGRDGREA